MVWLWRGLSAGCIVVAALIIVISRQTLELIPGVFLFGFGVGLATFLFTQPQGD